LAVDLVQKMLCYNPSQRIKLYDAMAHPLFNELREDDLTLPNGNCIPDLFSFTDKEKQEMGPENRDVLIPEWYDPYSSPGLHYVMDTD
jgi:serine/threonine protein kinase